MENLYSVKCYDKSNMNVFTLSLWKNFPWGLIYFDQFIMENGAFAPKRANAPFPKILIHDISKASKCVIME